MIAPVSTTLRPFRPTDVRRQVLLQQAAVSPDGEWVAYSRRTVEDDKYRSRLWRMPLRGGRPEQLTFADANDLQPRFSPSGNELVFLSDRSERSQPWILPLGGGEPRLATELQGNAVSASWSPDGRSLLVIAPSGQQRFVVGDPEAPLARRIRDLTWRLDGFGLRDQFHSAWIVPLRTGKPRRVTSPGYEVAEAAWLGERIAFLADRRDDAGVIEYPQLHTVSAHGGTARAGPALAGLAWTLAVSAGGLIALVGYDVPDPIGWENTGLFVVEGRSLRRLDEGLDRPIGNHTFADTAELTDAFGPRAHWLDEQSLVALVSSRGGSRPYLFPLDGEPTPLLDDEEVVCSGLAVGGGRVVVNASGRPDDAPDLYEVANGLLRRLTAHGGRWLRPHRIEAERITVRARNHPPVDAWLVPARGRRRRAPLVLKIHGGPHSAYGPVPYTETLALAHAGFHVLYANPQGSVGYGEAFARPLNGRWGELDAPEQLAVVDWAIRQGLASRDRIGVLGLSYGGFMVNWLLGHHPNRFAAGVSENPVTELVSHFGTCDFATWIGQTAVAVRFPHEEPDRYRELSPAFQIHRNTAPLLLLQCDGDLRCPPDQTEVVFGILRGLGREVEMVRYPEESHILLATGRPDRRVDRLERIVDWFERCL